MRDRRELLFLAAAIPFTLGLLFYYYTGLGGPIILASIMVPFAFVINSLDLYRSGQLYKRLPDRVVKALLVVYAVLAAAVAYYIVKEFYALVTVRAGSYTLADVAVGAIAFLLVMEYARRRHPALFYLNVFLVFYAVFGYVFPDILWHPGLSLERVITAMSVEFETGVFERLPQLALTLIGAFIMFVSVAQGFGLVDSVVRVVSGVMSRNLRLIPQAAVISSMAVASVSGSGAANAATTGSITIPLMKRIGFRPYIAAAVETAASLGGQLMPPIMGISAFIMADFLGVSYFDVIARGYVPALIYYAGIALAVYLLAARFLPKRAAGGLGEAVAKPSLTDYVKLAVFLSGIALLIFLMGVYTVAPMYSALLTAGYLLAASLAVTVFEARSVGRFLSLTLSRLARTVANFAAFVSDLTLLLATLAVMTGLLTITGLPTKIGFAMMDIGAGNIPLLAAIAFVFGYMVGLGLPPAATYVITALIIVPYLVEAGINPWVAHFYAFFLGVFSELSPPTSVTAAVAAKIAGTSFMRTMFYAMIICVPLFVLMPAVFLYPEMVAVVGAQQLAAGLVVGVAVAGFAAAAWARPSENRVVDAILRGGAGTLALLVLVARVLEPAAGLEYLLAGATALTVAYAIYATTRRG